MSETSDTPVFQCQQCGDCCSGRGGIIVRPDEVEAMAALLAIPVEEFCRRFVEASAMGPRLTVAERVLRLLDGGQPLPGSPGEALYLPPVAFSPGPPGGPGRTGARQNRLPGPQPGLQARDFVEEALTRREEQAMIAQATMPNDLHYFMFFVGRLFQGAEMMIRHSEYIEADESNLMYDFVAAREATREALRDVKGFWKRSLMIPGDEIF